MDPWEQQHQQNYLSYVYRESPYAKPVTCEPCLRENHPLCVKPCVCRHGKEKS